MAYNNDPIKDYNPASLKIDRLKEKLEMYIDREDSVTDLHDCSNDLSDSGSRKEEYEHAKFAEKKRQNFKQNYNTWSYNTTKKNYNNVNRQGVVVVIIVGLIALKFFISFFGIIGELLDDFLSEISYVEETNLYTDEDYVKETNSYLDYDEETLYNELEEDEVVFDFSKYKNNIIIENLRTQENNTYIYLNNLNYKSFSNLGIQSVFYDESGNEIYSINTYSEVILNDNIHFFEVFNAPREYARCEHILLDNDVKYSEIRKEDFYVTYKETDLNPKISLVHYLKEDINYATVTVAYMKEDNLIDIENYNFWNLKTGEEKERLIRQDKIKEINNYIKIVTVNDLKISSF